MEESSFVRSDIHELSKHARRLNGELTQVKKETDNKSKASKLVCSIDENGIFRMDKTLFLSKIVIFLNDSDLMNLSATNSGLRRLIYSPIGFRIIQAARTRENVKHVQPILSRLSVQQPIPEPKLGLSDISTSSIIAIRDRLTSMQFEHGEDFEMQIISFKQQMSFLANKLIEQIERTHDLNAIIHRINEDLEQEQNKFKKYPGRIAILEHQLQTWKSKLEEETTSNILKAEQHSEELMQLQQSKKFLIEENHLVQNEIAEIKSKYEKTKAALEATQKARDSYLNSLKKFQTLIVDVTY